MEELDGDVVLSAILPIGLRDGKVRLGPALVEIWRDVYFDTCFFGELGGTIGVVGFWVTTIDKNAAIVEKLEERYCS